MKFLIDNAISPDVAAELQAAGHDAVHVRSRDLQEAPDTTVFEVTFTALNSLIFSSFTT